jgi:hypothetical protein
MGTTSRRLSDSEGIEAEDNPFLATGSLALIIE